MSRTLMFFFLSINSVGLWGAGCTASPPQAASCAQYVECVRTLDARDGVETDVERFEAHGDCWGSDEGALLCARACTRGIEQLRRSTGAQHQECGQ